ncbi:MAG: hypothetical protein O3A48_01565 [Actinomycetota bacterium]|nr:hypothetical protein [Actinomycetota bacterium]MDA3013213.1 hypothetical protein [Actinomycetota bacterium]
MEKNQIYSEIESLMVELEVLIKSLANSREYIAEEDYQRAQFKLSEIEIELQSVAGRVAFIKSNI